MSHTENRFSHFWHYHKGKVFLFLLIIMLIVVGFSQCSTGEKRDLGILYVGPYDNVSGTEFINQIKNDISFLAASEEPDIRFTAVCLPSDPRAPAQSGELDKMQVGFVSGESTFFIVDKETIYTYQNDGYFLDITDYADKYSISEDQRYYDPDGKVIAVLADDNAYINSASLKTESLYLAVRIPIKDDEKAYDNSIKLFEHILNNK